MHDWLERSRCELWALFRFCHFFDWGKEGYDCLRHWNFDHQVYWRFVTWNLTKARCLVVRNTELTTWGQLTQTAPSWGKLSTISVSTLSCCGLWSENRRQLKWFVLVDADPVASVWIDVALFCFKAVTVNWFYQADWRLFRDHWFCVKFHFKLLNSNWRLYFSQSYSL